MAEAPLTLLLEYLDANPRPTFVVQQTLPTPRLKEVDSELIFTHANPALSQRESLHIEVVRQLQQNPHALRPVSLSRSSRKDRQTPAVLFCGVNWITTTVGSKWLVATSVEDPHQPREAQNSVSSTDFSSEKSEAALLTPKSTGVPICLPNEIDRKPPLGVVNPEGHLGDLEFLTWMRSCDWASSPVGPVDKWPLELRHACEHALATSDPINILWGDECTFLYNHAYSMIVGDKHPRAMGRPFKESFEQWPEYHRVLDHMKENGQSVSQERMRRMLVRDGFLEECFFDFLMAPILDADGSVVGFTTRIHEITRRVIFERRMQILTDTNKAIATTYTVQDLCAAAADVLDKHASDIHFAAMYSMHIRDGALTLILEATAGMDKSLTAFIPSDDSGASYFGLYHKLLGACETHESRTLSTSDGSLSQTTLRQLQSYGAQPCRDIIIHPLKCFVDDDIAAVIIVGTSPLRKFDEDYRSFLRLLTKQIENGITVARGVAREQETHKKKLTSELERRFWRFAESAPIGMYMYDAQDALTYCNTAFENISGTPRTLLAEPMAWMNMIHPDGAANMRAIWEGYTQSRRDATITFEVQFKKPWISTGDDAEMRLDRTYALGTLQPEYHDDGTLKGTLGCITDISSVKWAEKIQSARLSEAIEQRRQQENFLDVTSHEMRNPLNAIFQCAYELTENIKLKFRHTNSTQDQIDTLNECLDLAMTITYCANHQKRIVDDVLTLSKLDARLLQIYPETTNPIKLYKEILGLFAPEIRASGMNTNFMVDEGYNRLAVDHVMIDPNRVTQIVINLLSNAIKFTKKGMKRDLQMTLNAHVKEPATKPMGTRYVPSGVQHQDPTGLSEWGQGEILWLSFSVKDSGLGMTAEEASKLFQKFSQASPRTHTQFGGSGLGLYISRNLAELHGGRIGLSSQTGFGSTFEFYIKVRRSEVLQTPTTTVDDPISTNDLEHRIITSPLMQQARPALSQKQLDLVDQTALVQSPLPHQINVLVVEDNLINQRLLCKLITKHGYDTTTANNGEEALAYMASSTWNPIHTKGNSDIVPSIEIVLCDIEMPIMDGKTCVRRVRQLQQEGLLTRNIPMIAITGNARLEQVEEMRRCGFDDVVTKPYRIDQLLRIIERYVGMRDEKPAPVS